MYHDLAQIIPVACIYHPTGPGLASRPTYIPMLHGGFPAWNLFSEKRLYIHLALTNLSFPVG
jgi:hypothetical protein